MEEHPPAPESFGLPECVRSALRATEYRRKGARDNGNRDLTEK